VRSAPNTWRLGARVSWLSLKTKGDGFRWFDIKTNDDDFLQFGIKTGGDDFSWSSLKIGISGLVIWVSKSSQRFLDLDIKTN
jgi:hypothetical protein